MILNLCLICLTSDANEHSQVPGQFMSDVCSVLLVLIFEGFAKAEYRVSKSIMPNNSPADLTSLTPAFSVFVRNNRHSRGVKLCFMNTLMNLNAPSSLNLVRQN